MSISSLDAAPRGDNTLKASRLVRHWGWIDVDRKVTLNGVKMVIKQSVRYNYWSRKNNYRWYRNIAPVVIWFGLWDLAEKRHANHVAKVETAEEREEREYGEAWLKQKMTFRGRRFIGISEADEWAENKTPSEKWMPKGELFLA